jgi:hypothetical protein
MTALHDGTQAGNRADCIFREYPHHQHFPPGDTSEYSDYALEASASVVQRPYYAQMQYWMWGDI